MKRTEHDKVFVARNGFGRVLRGNTITGLIAAAEAADLAQVRRHLAELLPGFREKGDGYDRARQPHVTEPSSTPQVVRAAKVRTGMSESLT